MRSVTLCEGKTSEELESNINKYFHSDRYRVEGSRLMRRESIMSGWRVHYEWREVGGYTVQAKDGTYQLTVLL